MQPLNWDLYFLFQNLHSYKVNNQWVEFEKNLNAGSFSEDWP